MHRNKPNITYLLTISYNVNVIAHRFWLKKKHIENIIECFNYIFLPNAMNYIQFIVA